MESKLTTNMKHRSPVAVFFLPYFTLGIYWYYWCAETKGNANKLGAKIPTAWLLLIPFVNIWWLWRYSEGVEEVTKKGIGKLFVFLMLLLLGGLGMAIVQSKYNDYS